MVINSDDATGRFIESCSRETRLLRFLRFLRFCSTIQRVYTGFLAAEILDGRAFRSESWIVTE